MRKLFQILFLILIPALAFGATAAPTVISTATVVGSTVTVNSTAHGLSRTAQRVLHLRLIHRITERLRSGGNRHGQ